jgi:hypothetical protein
MSSQRSAISRQLLDLAGYSPFMSGIRLDEPSMNPLALLSGVGAKPTFHTTSK